MKVIIYANLTIWHASYAWNPRKLYHITFHHYKAIGNDDQDYIDF
jgi:hypothetical protein